MHPLHTYFATGNIGTSMSGSASNFKFLKKFAVLTRYKIGPNPLKTLFSRSDVLAADTKPELGPSSAFLSGSIPG